jgi:hypothetical protein
MRLAAGLISGLTIAILGFWLVFVRAPSPTETCEHKIALTYQEAGETQPAAADALIERLRIRCVADEERRIQLRGKLEYAKRARCIAAAQQLGDAERC